MASLVSRWHSRHLLHKLGALGILTATVLFIVGFSVPTWTTGYGLWTRCSSSLCISNLDSHADGWLTAVRVVECVALLAYVLCCLTLILQDCFLVCSLLPCSRTVEILGGVAGIASITGTIVFGVCWSNKPSQGDGSSDLYWGFGLVVTASVFILLSALAIGLTRHKDSHSTQHNKNMPHLKTRGQYFIDQGSTFQHCDDPDSSSMMLVPASHFDTSRTLNNERSDPPPPYALPPPYPYRSPYDIFFPIANSSILGPASSISPTVGHSQVMNGVNESLSVTNMDRVLTTPSQSFISSTFCIQSNRPVMRPLFIKTSDGTSEIEITPSAQNSSGLPSPFSHF